MAIMSCIQLLLMIDSATYLLIKSYLPVRYTDVHYLPNDTQAGAPMYNIRLYIVVGTLFILYISMYFRQTRYCHVMYNILVDWSCEVKQNCVLLKIKSVKRTMLKLRGGTTAFQIEMGRWHAWSEEEDMQGVWQWRG